MKSSNFSFWGLGSERAVEDRTSRNADGSDCERDQAILPARRFLCGRPTYRRWSRCSSQISQEIVSYLTRLPITYLPSTCTDNTLTLSSPSSTWITLATAHPAKFSSAVDLALSSSDSSFNFDRDVLPDELRALEKMEKRITKVQGEKGVRELIERVKRGKEAEQGRQGEGAGSI